MNLIRVTEALYVVGGSAVVDLIGPIKTFDEAAGRGHGTVTSAIWTALIVSGSATALSKCSMNYLT